MALVALWPAANGLSTEDPQASGRLQGVLRTGGLWGGDKL